MERWLGQACRDFGRCRLRLHTVPAERRAKIPGGWLRANGVLVGGVVEILASVGLAADAADVLVAMDHGGIGIAE